LKLFQIFIFLSFSSCSYKSLLPPTLAVVGGGVGAVATGGTPMGAGLGAGLGAGAGSLLLLDKSKDQSEELVIEALTKDGANALINAKLESAKNNGFFDGVLAEVYGVLKLCVIGLALWFLIPMLYTHYHAKKNRDGK